MLNINNKKCKRSKDAAVRNSAPVTDASHQTQEPIILLENDGIIRIGKDATPDMLAIWFVSNLTLEYLRQFTDALTLEVLHRRTCKK